VPLMWELILVIWGMVALAELWQARRDTDF
jgi:hypothetical protein